MGVTTQNSQWYDEFEAALDGVLAVFLPERRLPEPPAHVARRPEAAPRWRTGQKRGALAKFLRAHPAEVRNHQDALMHVVVRDLDASFNEFLILPIIAAVGHRAVHEAIIEYMAGGSFTEQVGAVQAWYTAQPGLHYQLAWRPGPRRPDRRQCSAIPGSEIVDFGERPGERLPLTPTTCEPARCSFITSYTASMAP